MVESYERQQSSSYTADAQRFSVSPKNVTVSKYEALLFSTALSIAFFGFLYIGEMIACGKSSDNSHLIHATDVAIYEQNVENYVAFFENGSAGKISQVAVLSKSRSAYLPCIVN